MRISRWAGAAAGALLLPAAISAQATAPSAAVHAGHPAAAATAAAATAPAVTESDLRVRIAAFAHDSTAGRRAGTPGHDDAVAYIAAELARIGAEPAGEDGTYFQTVPMERRGIDDSSTLVLAGQELELWKDFAPLPVSGAVGDFDGRTAVYGGTLGDSTLIEAEAAAGKVVVFDVGASLMQVDIPRAGPGGELPDAAAILIVEPMLERFAGYLQRPRTRLGGGDDVEAGPTILIADASALFDSPLDSLEIGAAGKPVGGRVVATVEAMPTRNVVAVVRGSDPAVAGQYVAYGAHSDHIGTTDDAVDHDSLRAYNRVVRPLGAESPRRPATPEEEARIGVLLDSLRESRPARADSVYNGADDDASGSMAVLELAEYFATTAERPRRSLLFVWHTAEEAGLYGSEWFTDHPTVPRDSIVAQINLDMIGRGAARDTEGGGPDFLQLLGSRRLSTEFGDLIESVNAGLERPFRLDYELDADGHPLRIYCRSDHWNYARYGIPIVFFTTGSHQDYHQLTDEIEYIDYPHITAITRYLARLGTAAANLDHRLAVDHPVPSPDAECVQ